ncbi:hypothetical protein [Lentzea sp. CA-135723]|uniref:hypothetical protein n=1 Tax=Lentzea sp. CA-135723 TaxID=3239950 RepID=UPI003D9370B2
MTALWRTLALLSSVGAGYALSLVADVDGAESTAYYRYFVTALLGFGLYASTRGIDIAEFRDQLGTVLLAVTLGVLAKSVMIAGVVYLAFGEPWLMVLGIAVAQIDPLSVAAMRSKSKMSPSAKALLSAWASFDDPITVLLTVYFTALALHASNGAVVMSAGLAAFLWNLLWNLVLAGAAFLVWHGFLKVRARLAAKWHTVANVVMGVVVLAVAFFAVVMGLLLAIALIGLFFRPPLGRFVDAATQVALYTGCAAMGLVLVLEVRWLLIGLVLGTAAYLSQIVTAFALTTPRRWRGDRVRLALGQQNGLTAIILALLLEPDFPGAIAVIAVAIVVVNVLNAVCNGLWDHFRPPAWETSGSAAEQRPHRRAPDTRAEIVQRGTQSGSP